MKRSSQEDLRKVKFEAYEKAFNEGIATAKARAVAIVCSAGYYTTERSEPGIDWTEVDRQVKLHLLKEKAKALEKPDRKIL